MDDQLTQITKKAIQFRDERDWKQFHDPKNLAEAITIESGELLEKFLWIKDTNESYQLNNKQMDEVREEIADVMIYLIYICEGLRIDLIEAVEKKIQQNGEKYPVVKSKGNSKKYKDLD